MKWLMTSLRRVSWGEPPCSCKGSRGVCSIKGCQQPAVRGGWMGARPALNAHTLPLAITCMCFCSRPCTSSCGRTRRAHTEGGTHAHARTHDVDKASGSRGRGVVLFNVPACCCPLPAPLAQPE
jgi:hypothetical protein